MSSDTSAQFHIGTCGYAYPGEPPSGWNGMGFQSVGYHGHLKQTYLSAPLAGRVNWFMMIYDQHIAVAEPPLPADSFSSIHAIIRG